MTYQTFVQEVQDRLNQRQEQGEGLYSAKADMVTRLQDSYYGLVISTGAEWKINLGVNLKDYYLEAVDSGLSLEEIVDRLDQGISREIRGMSGYDFSKLWDYGYVKDHLGLQVINQEKNRDRLKTIPYTPIADLAVIYRVFPDEKTGALINNGMLQKYGISREQLHEDALACARRKMPFMIRTVKEEMKVLLGKENSPKEADGETAEVYFAGTDGAYGASVIARPDFYEKAVQIAGEDFYILPCSINEVLLVSSNKKGTVEDYENMVKEMNSMVVDEAEYLSDRLYHYDGRNQMFETAADFERRIRNVPMMSM